MIPLARNAVTMLAVFLAAIAVPQCVCAGDSPRRASGALAEVQIGMCSPVAEIMRALDLRPRGHPITVWQFDDTALTLYRHGLRLRLRVAANGRSVFTLKVADQNCERLDPGQIPPGEGKCEYDAYGATTNGAVSLNIDLGTKNTSDLVAGRVTPAQLMSPSQIKYLRDIAGMWPLPSEIRKLGPMSVQSYTTKHKLYDIDLSQLPGGQEFAEISRKVPLEDASRTRRAMEVELSRAGIAMCADQSSQAVNKLRALLGR